MKQQMLNVLYSSHVFLEQAKGQGKTHLMYFEDYHSLVLKYHLVRDMEMSGINTQQKAKISKHGCGFVFRC